MTKRAHIRTASASAGDAPADPALSHPEPPAFTPVPRKCARHDGWTPARQRAFIDALNDTGSVRAACAAVNMAEVGAYQLRRQPGAEEFAAAWAAAQENGIGILRDALMHRAIHGVEVPVYSYGKLVGTRRTYNDRIGTFMLANYDGRLTGGASGLPLRLKRIVDAEVASELARQDEEKERKREKIDEEFFEKVDRVRAKMAEQALMDGFAGMSYLDTCVNITAIVFEVFERFPAQRVEKEAEDEPPSP